MHVSEKEHRRRSPLPVVAAAVFFATGLIVACSQADLQLKEPPATALVDNRLDLAGEVCTEPPKDQVFPVKIMLIVDCSGSMQFTDPATATASSCMSVCQANRVPNCAQRCAGAQNPGRQAAVQRLVDRFKNNPAVSFSLVRFNGRITINGGDAKATTFTNNPAVLSSAVAGLAQAEITTDYQGALSTAFEILEQDMLATDPVERARTKYVLIFLSDGSPDPVCQKGCGNDTVNIGVVVDSWCDVPRSDWCDNFNAGGALCDSMQRWYPSMAEPCQDYNTQTQILQKVTELMELGTRYGAGEIRLHTAFLFVDGLPQLVLDIFAINKARAETLLQAIAKKGDGLYRSFNAGQAIDFLDFNYASVARPFGMTSLIVTNDNVIARDNRLVEDSDGDGVDDAAEFDAQAGMKGLSPDSDGDGYGDKLEVDRRNAGFDPGDAKVPVRACSANERIDRDGDGLLDCEEAILGTDPKIADTDRDRLPDGVEFRFGTNPLEDDSKTDVDFDGKFAGEEISGHTDPSVSDTQAWSEYRYLYDVQEQPERSDRRRCYAFNVRRLRLLTTEQRSAPGTSGFNDILVYFGEGPADDPRDYGDFKAACVRAQYVEPNFKIPPSGTLQLTPENFYPLPELLERRSEARNDPSVDPCVGAPLP